MYRLLTTRYQRRVLRRVVWAALGLPQAVQPDGASLAEPGALESLVGVLKDSGEHFLGHKLVVLDAGQLRQLYLALRLALSTGTLETDLELPRGPAGEAGETVARALLEALGDLGSLVDAQGVVDLRDLSLAGF